MDYKTKPTSREELRGIARFVRKLFKCKNKYRFDVMDAFERIPSVIPAVTCLVVEDDEIEGDIPARCVPDFEGHYTIEVKSSIYDGAAEGILDGYDAVLGPSQAKALCGEILMPYEETEGLSVRQIRHLCQVSRESAELRYNNYRKPEPKTPLERRARQWF